MDPSSTTFNLPKVDPRPIKPGDTVRIEEGVRPSATSPPCVAAPGSGAAGFNKRKLDDLKKEIVEVNGDAKEEERGSSPAKSLVSTKAALTAAVTSIEIQISPPLKRRRRDATGGKVSSSSLQPVVLLNGGSGGEPQRIRTRLKLPATPSLSPPPLPLPAAPAQQPSSPPPRPRPALVTKAARKVPVKYGTHGGGRGDSERFVLSRVVEEQQKKILMPSSGETTSTTASTVKLQRRKGGGGEGGKRSSAH